MIEVRQTGTFTKWIKAADANVRARVVVRIRRLQAGNPGETRTLDGGVSEMKIDFGPGYRVYFARRGETVVILLCGGNKRTQQADIKLARKLAEGV